MAQYLKNVQNLHRVQTRTGYQNMPHVHDDMSDEDMDWILNAEAEDFAASLAHRGSTHEV